MYYSECKTQRQCLLAFVTRINEKLDLQLIFECKTTRNAFADYVRG